MEYIGVPFPSSQKAAEVRLPGEETVRAFSGADGLPFSCACAVRAIVSRGREAAVMLRARKAARVRLAFLFFCFMLHPPILFLVKSVNNELQAESIRRALFIDKIPFSAEVSNAEIREKRGIADFEPAILPDFTEISTVAIREG